jgi:hypothetical protein
MWDWGGGGGHRLDRSGDRWRAVVNAVINLWVAQNAGNFFTTWGPVSFSQRPLLHEVRRQLASKRCICVKWKYQDNEKSSNVSSWRVKCSTAKKCHVTSKYLASLTTDGQRETTKPQSLLWNFTCGRIKLLSPLLGFLLTFPLHSLLKKKHSVLHRLHDVCLVTANIFVHWPTRTIYALPEHKRLCQKFNESLHVDARC